MKVKQRMQSNIYQKKYLILSFLLFTFFTHFIQKTYASTENFTDEPFSKFKFKLGFEFQESSHLCPWNTERNDIQNKSVFHVSKGETELWKLVIDTFDIEFVTEPFSSDS